LKVTLDLCIHIISSLTIN